jgi:hypothetical protein
MSMFGYNHEDANELLRILEKMVENRGLNYTLDYLGRCISCLGTE